MNITMELDSFYDSSWLKWEGVISPSYQFQLTPRNSMNGVTFSRNRGTASMGENNKVIWYYQLSWLPNISCLLSNKTLKYVWKAPAALSNSLAIFNTVKRMTTWNLLKTVAFLNHLKVSEWEMPAQGCQPLEICNLTSPHFRTGLIWPTPRRGSIIWIAKAQI